METVYRHKYIERIIVVNFMKRSKRNVLNLRSALLAILAITCTASFAQTSIDSCSASPAERQFHEELAKSPHAIELLREKLGSCHPG
jgi:hypothetical protein